MPLSPRESVQRWRPVNMKERSASQSPFRDLCALLGQQTPVQADLNAARGRLLRYHESLESPPPLVLYDLHTIILHLNSMKTVDRPEPLPSTAPRSCPPRPPARRTDGPAALSRRRDFSERHGKGGGALCPSERGPHGYLGGSVQRSPPAAAGKRSQTQRTPHPLIRPQACVPSPVSCPYPERFLGVPKDDD